MSESEQSPTPLTEAVWPPAPLRDEPPPLLLRVEGMQLTRSGDRLVVMLCLSAGIWCWFTFLFNLGGVTLDKRDATVRADGRRARPTSKIKAVHIKIAVHPIQGRQYILRLLWDDEPVSRWRKAWTTAPANSSFLGSFRHETNADQVAGIIAAFIGVPVQKVNGIFPAIERDQHS